MRTDRPAVHFNRRWINASKAINSQQYTLKDRFWMYCWGAVAGYILFMLFFS